MKKKMNCTYVWQLESILFVSEMVLWEFKTRQKPGITYSLAIMIFLRQQLFYLLRTQQGSHPLVLILVPNPKPTIGITSLVARAGMYKPAQGSSDNLSEIFL